VRGRSYADRDSSEVGLIWIVRTIEQLLIQCIRTEEEMLDGVAKWKYVDEDSDEEQSGEEFWCGWTGR